MLNARHVEYLAQNWGLPFLVVHAQEGEVKQSEAAGREWRYRALTRMAEKVDCGLIATGHTASDVAETLLFNLLRGSGGDGLQALGHSRDLGPGRQLVRPLLRLLREETGDFCEAQHLEVWEDSTNQDNRFARNRIRNELLPYLKAHFNPRVDVCLAQTADLLRADVTYLEEQARGILQAARGEPGGGEYSAGQQEVGYQASGQEVCAAQPEVPVGSMEEGSSKGGQPDGSAHDSEVVSEGQPRPGASAPLCWGELEGGERRNVEAVSGRHLPSEETSCWPVQGSHDIPPGSSQDSSPAQQTPFGAAAETVRVPTALPGSPVVTSSVLPAHPGPPEATSNETYSLNRTILRTAPLTLQRRAVRLFLQQARGRAISYDQVGKVLKMMDANNGAQSDMLWGRVVVVVEGPLLKLKECPGTHDSGRG